MVEKPHLTLQPKFNIILTCVWLLFVTTIFLFTNPRPLTFLIYGIIAGAIGGVFQWLSFNSASRSFVDAKTMIEVRNALKNTKWGKIYLYYFWIFNFTILLLAFLSKQNSIQKVVIGYLSFACTREIVTLYPTFKLEVKIGEKK